MLFISIDLLVILYAFYPMSRKRRDIIFTFCLALLLSFALSIIRLAIMALVVNDAPKFNYWHGSPGSNLFMTICLVGSGLYAISRMPARQSETSQNYQPLPPLANPEWIIKGFLLAIAVVLTFLILLPDGGAKRLASFQFPENILLPGWQVVRSQAFSLKEMASFIELEAEQPVTDLPQKVEQAQRQQWGRNILMSGRHYALKKDNTTTNMTLTYVLNSDATLPNVGNGDLNELTYEKLLEQAGVSAPYLVMEDENKIHLFSCLTSDGQGFVRQYDLFGANRIRQTLSSPQGIYQWMTGQIPLQDLRCVWVHLSESSVGDIGKNQRLIGLWQDLQRYWSKAFPSL
jgi:cyanosortase A-associated protein